MSPSTIFMSCYTMTVHRQLHNSCIVITDLLSLFDKVTQKQAGTFYPLPNKLLITTWYKLFHKPLIGLHVQLFIILPNSSSPST